MQPSSRSSNRTNPNARSYQPYQPDLNDIFNASFYQEKLDSGESYQSL